MAPRCFGGKKTQGSFSFWEGGIKGRNVRIVMTIITPVTLEGGGGVNGQEELGCSTWSNCRHGNKVTRLRCCPGFILSQQQQFP